jgi:hypothetical protein
MKHTDIADYQIRKTSGLGITASTGLDIEDLPRKIISITDHHTSMMTP